MDANGLRFWLLADRAHWHLGNVAHTRYDAERRALRLASEPAPALPAVGTPSEQEAKSLLEITPQTRDSYGTRAYWSNQTWQVLAAGAVRGATPIYAPPEDLMPSDLVMGYDGILYLAFETAGIVLMLDRRGRWQPVRLQDDTFKPWRLAADPSGGVWAVDRLAQQLARVTGEPLPTRPYAAYSANTARPCTENPHPPTLTRWPELALPANQSPVAIACNEQGRLAVLSWQRAGLVHDETFAHLHCLSVNGQPPLGLKLLTAAFPYSLTWLSATRLAVLVARVAVVDEKQVLHSEAVIYDLPDEQAEEPPPKEIAPVGDLYPLRNRRREQGPFVHGVMLPPHYPSDAGTAPLHRLSLPSYARNGEVTAAQLLDSGSRQTVWHRIYLEAEIPAHCGVEIELAANDTGAPPAENEWYPHRFGARYAQATDGPIPRGAWVSQPSELPLHPGFLSCPPKKNVSGLFTALIQRATRNTRSLRGRYLHVRLKLVGDGRATPEVAAVRFYGSRFSYLNQYLPELYQETLFGNDGEQIATRATPADFLERFLGNFESLLTPLEDQIAGAYLLTDPRTTRAEALEWLGSWIGLSFDAALPTARRREMLATAPRLYQQRGTLEGLQLALDLATGGAVSSGEIVVLENFRLRRVFATILGADLADEEDPLLGGLAISGNSFVGDTLWLGDENKKEFLALFSASLEVTDAEQAAIDTLFDSTAYRVTVLVHQEVEPQDLGLIRRVVALETPAHVEVQVLTATHPFIVSLASLIGVDTYLGRRPAPAPARINRSLVGVRDFITRPASLDPRLEGGRYDLVPPQLERPVADAGPPQAINEGDSFTLDGGKSHGPRGKTLKQYRWKRLD